MINEILKLGTNIENKWQKENNNKDTFSKISLSELSQFNSAITIDEFNDQIANWLFEEAIPDQLNVYNTFGQPPVTVFNNGKFVIDIYFWMHEDTSIHSHSFSGAFKLIYGRSIQEIYSVNAKELYAKDVMSTDIERTSITMLSVGDVQEILAGDKLCHRVVHLDSPTVTLCVRTVDDKDVKQWHHFSNGLSILKKEHSEKTLKKLFYYQYLLINNEKKGKAFLSEFIDKISISEVMNIFEALTVDSMGLGEHALEYFYETLMKTYQGTKWFSIYEEYCNKAELNVYPEEDSASERFICHAVNTNYKYSIAMELLSKIQNTPFTEIQKLQLGALNTNEFD